ncbi:bifunctional heptose 7-phosphate kinase/heptose 1-phosphate adenyltransferase, partial [Mesorhizobium sp. M7A.F.Ca.AU.001.01.1.1]
MIKHNPPSPEPLHRAIARFGQATVLVVGDFILDRFVNGVIERISPEAPIPVLHGRGETSTMGGAGNVVANIVSLGAAAVPVSVIGADLAGDSLVRMLRELGADTAGLAQEPGRMTSSKSRFSALNQQVLRFDEEEIKPLGAAERAGLIR